MSNQEIICERCGAEDTMEEVSPSIFRCTECGWYDSSDDLEKFKPFERKPHFDDEREK